MFKSVEITEALEVPMDTLTPSGIYFRPFTEDELAGADKGFTMAGDFFLLLHRKGDAAPRVSLLPWSSHTDGNQYPAGSSGVKGEIFDPRDIGGKWLPLRFVPRSEDARGQYIGLSHHLELVDRLQAENQNLLERCVKAEALA